MRQHVGDYSLWHVTVIDPASRCVLWRQLALAEPSIPADEADHYWPAAVECDVQA